MNEDCLGCISVHSRTSHERGLCDECADSLRRDLNTMEKARDVMQGLYESAERSFVQAVEDRDAARSERDILFLQVERLKAEVGFALEERKIKFFEFAMDMMIIGAAVGGFISLLWYYSGARS